MTFVTNGQKFQIRGEPRGLDNVGGPNRNTPLVQDGSCDKSHCEPRKVALSCSAPANPYGLTFGRRQ